MTKETDRDIMDAFEAKCKSKGLKITPQRVAIFKALIESANTHPTAEMIYSNVRADMPNISYNTVNTTLTAYKDIGIIDIVETKGLPKRFDPITAHHHHFKCLRCNSLIDIYNDVCDILPVPKELCDREFEIVNKKILWEGFCKDCSRG
ncbi:ferric uptake regulator, FUR family [Candidatus Magnetoovum chiemensis]|nr:ferric uptake regulator, FUR family [Candidatus Magnetoovum chiemensis]